VNPLGAPDRRAACVPGAFYKSAWECTCEVTLHGTATSVGKPIGELTPLPDSPFPPGPYYTEYAALNGLALESKDRFLYVAILH
jgi:hypothetical protein